MTRQTAIVLSVLLWVASCGAVGARAQGAPPEQPGPSEQAGSGDTATPAGTESVPEPAPPAPVRTAADLTTQIDLIRARLREIRSQIARGRPPLQIEESLSGAERQLAALHRERERLDLDRLSLHALDELRQKVARFASRIADWKKTLDVRASDLSDSESGLEALQKEWSASRENVPADEIPPALEREILAVDRDISTTGTDLRGRLETLIAVRSRVGAMEAVITDLNEEISAASDEVRSRLYRPDNPPLWTMILSPEGGSYRQQLESAWKDQKTGFEEFLAEYGSRLPFQIVMFLALAAGLFSLHRRSARWEIAEDEESLKTALRVFSRPCSAALLVTLLFTRAFYPHAPRMIFEAAGLLGLVPLLRLIPRLVYAHLRPAVYSLGGLFALQQLRELAPPQTTLARLLLLVLSALTLLLALWAQRWTGKTARGVSPFWTTTRVLIRITAAMLAVTIVANLIGAVRLAELWTTAVLASAYLGVAIFAGVLILDALLTVGLRSRWARATGMISHHGDLIHRRLLRALRVFGALAWAIRTLKWFGVVDPAMRGLRSALATRWVVGNLDVSPGDIIAFVVAIYLSMLVSRFTRFVLDEDVFPRVTLPRGVSATLTMLIHYGILGLGFLFALSAAGFEVSQFAIVAGALGVGIGFGLQNVVNNFISGLILVFERPIKIGDTIEVDQLMGEVRRIGIRSSTVRTFDGAEVIVPNGNLISREVINWTLSDRVRRIRLPVGVAYGTDPVKVLALLTEVAQKNKDVLRQPAPSALFRSFGESSLDFELRFWTSNFDAWPAVQSAVTVGIYAALTEAGIEIPFPQRDLHLRSVEPSARRALAEQSSALESSGEEN